MMPGAIRWMSDLFYTKTQLLKVSLTLFDVRCKDWMFKVVDVIAGSRHLFTSSLSR